MPVTRSLRVLHLIDSTDIYGAESVLLNLASAQKSSNLSPIILSIGNPKSGEKAIERQAAKLEIPCLPFRMRDGFNIRGALQIIDMARAEGADLLHSHGYKTNILLGILPRSQRSKPLVTTLHGWTAKTAFSKLGGYRLLDQLLLKRMDAIVLVNEDMRLIPAIKRLPPGIVHYIANGIDITQPQLLRNDELADKLDELRNTGQIVVGAIGRLSPEKNFSALIDAVALLKSRDLGLQVVVLGAGPEQAKLTQLIRSHGLENQVTLAGYISNAQRYLPHMDVLVLPSLTEGLPLTVLEAMSSATPVIASSVGGIPSALDGLGTLVAPGNTHAIAAALAAFVITPQKYREMALASRQRALDVFSTSGMSTQYEKLYRSLIRSS